MSEYYRVDVSRAMLKEYMEITNMQKTEHGREVVVARKKEIIAHIFTQAFAKYSAEFAKEESLLELVK